MKTKNRWLIAASAVGIQTSIGSIYAYSAWKMPLENTFGWSSTKTSMAFSIAIFCLGLSAAFLGRFIQSQGPRKGGLIAAAFFCCGLIGAGIACTLENLWLFYLCFGVISGIGLGVGYITPVSTLVKWFPDRRGLATGLAIMGFGFGGLICAKLIDQFAPPQAEIVLDKEISAHEYYLAKKDSPEQAADLLAGAPDIESFKAQSKRLQELTHAGITDNEEYGELKSLTEHYRTTLIYDKQSICRAFYLLGAIYLFVMVPSSLYIAVPPEGYEKKFASSTNPKASATVMHERTAREAVRIPGFYGLWLMLFLNATCGIAVIATAKKMGYEMVHLSDSMANLMVMGISLFNGLGRIAWATLSDKIGRANTFIAFFVIEIAAFPLLANLTGTPFAFMAVTFLILTCYGGGFSTIPAYISDLFGLKSMPTVLGYILTAWSMAGIVGPLLNSYVYEKTHSYQQSLYVFGGMIALALVISLLMKVETKRLGHHHSNEEIEDARPHTHGN
ncbi:OFA family MFS transporter [Coraliomargarita parva]|uniref:OFA family MFS transporter n=1 Tax=Coraliomargarita parva TaxID=3014050 RepID=UPI0022B58A2B|nr:OFA family MFS transporter [Coraliomargarita parva]